MRLQASGHWFIDDQGRKVLLRGVNLGGDTKVPFVPNGATHLPTDFSDHTDVSFIGRPFPLEEADTHFQRLQHWGFNCLRFLTTWEAIEHSGAGEYDTTYLDYYAKLVEIAGDYGFYIFVDPHQDVWSRMTGGDGAPGWTFEKAGLDFTTFKDNGAARVMQYHYPQSYEQMEWFRNHQRFATATMFTLFFGSEHFAPEATIDGQSMQSYFQSHFIDAMLEIAKRVKDFDHVIGFDSFNEPHPGFIGIDDIGAFPEIRTPGPIFSPFDAIASGAGYPRTAHRYEIRWLRLKEVGEVELNPEGVSSWIADDIWEQHGIYEDVDGEPVLLQPHHFSQQPDGKQADFSKDFLKPFAIEYITKIREIIPDALLFIEGDPLDPKLSWDSEKDPKGVVNASHWYDGWTLFTKSYRSWFTINTRTQRPVFLPGRVKQLHTLELIKLQEQSLKIGNVPTLIGEFGIPYDMNGKKAYLTGNFKDQISALSTYYEVIDDLQLHSTQWNYTAHNNNEWGDLWNMEDLSIYSKDQADLHEGINSGGRAIAGFCRPYPQKISGKPIIWKFDYKKQRFHLDFISDGKATQIYLPNYHYDNPRIDLEPEVEFDLIPTEQLLILYGKKDQRIKVTVTDL